MCRCLKYKRKTGGFTLIESVIFIVIAGVTIPSILLGLGMSAKSLSESMAIYRNAVIADSIMKEKMEELIGLPYSNAQLAVVNSAPLAITEPGFSGLYSIRFVSSALADRATDAGYKRIIITVTTPEARSYSLTAIVTNWKL